ncbi:MAG: LutC/YkgG family protein [Chitinophagaceae bacterium]
MQLPNSKEKVLQKIREALVKPSDKPFGDDSIIDNYYQPSTKELEIEFAENFTQLQGKFLYCSNFADMQSQLQQLLALKNLTKIICKEENLLQQFIAHGFTSINNNIKVDNCDAAITTCEQLIARTGSLLLSSNNESGRTTSVYAPIHICIAYSHQLVYDISHSLQNIKEKYKQQLPSVISLATGPSRTADIEKTLVVGVHGPKEVYCFLIDE